jgi:hypothetical protein
MAQWEDVLEDCFIGLYRPGALPSCVEPPPQHVALPFGTLQALGEHVAVVSALFEFGMEAPAAGQMRDEITNEPPQPGH